MHSLLVCVCQMLDDVTRSLVLALGVCYHACLQDTPREIGQKDLNTRAKYRKAITPYFLDPCDLPGGQQRIRDEISRSVHSLMKIKFQVITDLQKYILQ